jgi:crotonobetainyl-CoA:carnitine CoA-transferase CaiB-like acyl-CoA transferase
LLIIAVGNDAQFRRLCSVLGCAAVADDPRFQSNSGRVTNRTRLIGILAEKIATWTSAVLQSRLRSEGIPCGPIHTLDQVFSSPQVLARDMVVELQHDTLGRVKTVANPTKFSSTKITYDKAPPTLGQHTAEVLAKLLAMDSRSIEDLRRRGIL